MTKRTMTAGLALAVVMFLGSNCFAQITLSFVAAGSTGAWEAMGLAAAQSNTCGTNVWTVKKGTVNVIDGRSSSIPAETGNTWIIWNTAKTTACIYVAVDSVIGQQLFFAVPRATMSVPSTAAGTAGANLIPTITDVPLDATIQAALNGATLNAAPTDVRPEDALFEENRVLAPLDTVHYNGLGYGPGPIGIPILSDFSSGSVTPTAFALSGKDPITELPVPAWTTSNVGAQVMIFAVGTQQTGSTGDFSNVAAFQNVNRRDLTNALNGTYAWTRDISSTPGLPQQPLNVVLREPTSGTYTTTEFNIPRNVETTSTQELGVNPSAPGGNPLDIANPYSGGWRKRTVGSGEEVSEIVSSSNGNVLGYAFWSTGNWTSAVSTARYLTVDGVDPLFATYAGGFFPTCTAPCPGLVSFTNVLNGSYPVWNILTVTTAKVVPAGVTTLISNAQTFVQNVVPDFVPIAQMNVFRSHFTQSGRGAANGYQTGHPESGGSVGGAVFTVQADLDDIIDTGKELINFKQ